LFRTFYKIFSGRLLVNLIDKSKFDIRFWYLQSFQHILEKAQEQAYLFITKA